MMRFATQKEARVLYKALKGWRGYRFPGGLPARYRMLPRQFDQHQLAIGTQIELEHTAQPPVAMEIAMAHLIEDRRYYEKLERMGL